MLEMVFNLIIVFVLLMVALVIIARLVKRDYNISEEIEVNPYSIDYLTDGIKIRFDDILNKNISDLNLNKEETLKREKNKSQIRQAKRDCSQGDIGAKAEMKLNISDMLQKDLNVNESTINRIIPFEGNLSVQDKFEILMFLYMKKYEQEALKELISRYHLADLKEDGKDEYYEITGEDICKAYEQENPRLDYMSKLEIVSQRIYQLYSGLGVVDNIRDMNIDGIHAGVSGIPVEFYSYDIDWLETVRKEHLNSYDSIWIFFQGKMIHLSFLGFANQKELIRACKNIYRYGNPGQLDETKGYIINEAKDSARVTVFRPRLSAGWAFIVRKYDTIPKKELNAVLIDDGKEKAISLVKSFIKGKLTIIVTGEMGCGKTTFLMGMIDLLRKTSRIRSYEKIFELYISKHFPKMNVLMFRKTDSINGQQALDAMLTTDGNVTILGEVGTHEDANLLMNIKEKNPNTNMATCHTDTAESLVSYFTSAKLIAGGYSDEKIAEREVIKFLNIDIHMVNDDGHRYIQRITEIVPVKKEEYPAKLADAFVEYFKRVTNPITYEAVDILVFENGKYVIKNELSLRTKEKILKNLNLNERSEFLNLFSKKEAACE